MEIDDRYRLFEAARVRAELTVPELWLRYLALGGNGDEFDIEGYLQGLVPLETFDQQVLAVALNERLDDVYRSARIPLPTPTPEEANDGTSPELIADLLGGNRSKPRAPDQTDGA
jgi:hypothetical protein